MPSQQRVEQYVESVQRGDHAGTIAEFYAPEASMRENLAEPRRGRETLIAHEKKALSRLARMQTHPPREVLVAHDLVCIHWTFDAIGHDGVARRLEELALQRWQGDRIVEEQFFYDSATAWRTLP